MLNYDKPSRIFPCILLTRNHMIFLVQFGINKHLLISSKTTTGSCNFVSLSKNLLVLIYSKLHSKSCDYLYEHNRPLLRIKGDFFKEWCNGFHNPRKKVVKYNTIGSHLCTCHTGYTGDRQTCFFFHCDFDNFPSMSRKVLYYRREATSIAALPMHTIPATQSGR